MTKIKLWECWSQVLINSTIFATFTFLVPVLLYIPQFKFKHDEAEFSNGKGWGGGNWKFYWGGGYRVKETWGGVILKIQTFLWKMNIKLKINMTCVSKEYDLCVQKQKWCRSNDYN